MPRPLQILLPALSIVASAALVRGPWFQQDEAVQQRVPDPGHRLMYSAERLRCSFDTGTATTLGRGATQIAQERPLELMEVYDAIDRQAGRARYITDVGTHDVQVVAGTEMLSFVDTNRTTGNIQLTSVFPAVGATDSLTARGRLLAVSSTHNRAVSGAWAAASQHSGFCDVLP